MWHAIEPFAAYGFNKCLSGDSEILDLESGELKTIENLYNTKKNLSVLSLNKKWKTETKKIPKIFKNGKKKTWKLKTRSGREIVATKNHRFLTFDGWKEMKEISRRSFVATPRTIKYKASKKINKKKLKALAYLIAEGNLCHTHGLYYYSTVRSEVDDFVDSVKQFKNAKCTIAKHKQSFSVYIGKKDAKKPSELRDFIKACGLWHKKAVEKFIPSDVFKIDKKDLAVFIASLWQGDGCIKDDKYGQIFYATSSKKLSHQLQHLLLRLDIVSTIHTKSFKYKKQRRVGYTIHISKYNNIEKFALQAGPHLLENKLKVLNSIVKKNKVLNGKLEKGSARGTKDIIPSCVLGIIRKKMDKIGIGPKEVSTRIKCAERLFYRDVRRKGYQRETIEKIGLFLKSQELIDLARSEVYWDEVVEKKYIGVRETYDLTVPGNHNFIANDIVVHNSHAASYGIVAYQTAYMKAHYPVQFMTAVLAAEAGDSDKIALISHECRRMGIEVLPPDINESFKNFAMVSKPGEPGRIRFGLTAIKNVGENICEVIYRERKNNGQYKNLEDFLERVKDKDLNKKSVESLTKAGALDGFGHDRGVLLSNIENILSFIRHHKERQETKQEDLFAGTGIAFDNKVRLDSAEDAPIEEKMKWEKDLLGVYVSSHPFSKYEKTLGVVTTDLSEVEDLPRDRWVTVGGVVDKVTRKITKKGSVMLFVTLQDQSGSTELLVFPKKFEETKDLWDEGVVVCIVAKTPREDGDNKLFVDNIYILSEDNVEDVKRRVTIGQDTSAKKDTSEKSVSLLLTREILKDHGNQIREVLSVSHGDYSVYIRVGTKLIQSQWSVAWNNEMKENVEKIIGQDRIEVKE